MATNKRFLSLASSMLLGALPLGARALAASAAADDPTSAAAAEQTAEDYRDQANQYRQMGGVAYKTGLVQRSEAEAAKYDAIAANLRAPEAPPPVSPEAEQAAKRVADYKAIGGAGYKTGLVQRAEAEEQRQLEADRTAPAEPAPKPLCSETKPAAEVGADCSGSE